MKPIFVLCLAISLLSFTNTKQLMIIGTWESTDIMEGVLSSSVTFKEDSTFIFKTHFDTSWNQDSIFDTGTFKIKLDSLFLFNTESSDSFNWKIEVLDKKSLRISTINDDRIVRYNYRRKKN